MAQDSICDPETDKIVAIIRDGEFFAFATIQGRRLPPPLAPICMILRAIWLATCTVDT